MAPKSSKTDFRLRAILIPVYLPILILCICSAAIVAHCLPALGLIPCTASFLYSCFVVLPAWKKRHQHDDNGEEDEEFVRRWPVKKRGSEYSGPSFALVLDLCVSLSLLAVLICTWTISPWELGRRTRGQGTIVLATYTTVPMIFEFLAHSWLAIVDLRDIYRSLRHKRNTPAECPNCHARFHSSTSRIEVSQGERVEDYTINRPSEEVPFRDTSFDSDAAIGPDRHETATVGSKDS